MIYSVKSEWGMTERMMVSDRNDGVIIIQGVTEGILQNKKCKCI